MTFMYHSVLGIHGGDETVSGCQVPVYEELLLQVGTALGDVAAYPAQVGHGQGKPV